MKCNAKVSQLARWSTEGSEKEISYWPCGPEVIPYNEICRVCSSRQFEIREKRCDACERTDIKLISSGENGKNPITEAVTYYRCNKCDSNLLSDIKL